MNLDVPRDFSGVVSVGSGEDVLLERAYGLADRAHRIPSTVDTQFAIASGSKGFTALTVVSLIESGLLALDTPARSLLGADLPLIAAEVTVEHLLMHRSGIGDYIDEDEPGDVLPTVPVQQLVTTADYLPALDGIAPKFCAGEKFSYCNSGYVVLALLAERASGQPFHDLVVERVFAPAGMVDTAFLRSDELPGRAAVGYLDDGRTNVFHLPVRGNGDGGAYSTTADLRRFWAALFRGRIVAPDRVDRMVRRQSSVDGSPAGYGMGFWSFDPGVPVFLEGCDFGVSFRSMHDPHRAITATVIANTTDGAWPVARTLRAEAFS